MVHLQLGRAIFLSVYCHIFLNSYTQPICSSLNTININSMLHNILYLISHVSYDLDEQVNFESLLKHVVHQPS